METPKVFVPNKSHHNFKDALRYGKLIYVTTAHQSRYNINSMARCWQAVLLDSQPTDYILLTSLNTLCSVCASIFGAMHGRLNLLIWKEGRYIAREIILNDKGDRFNDSSN